MPNMAFAAWIFLPFVVPICIWVAYSDLSRMKIPNKAVIALAAGFVISALFAFEMNDYLLRIAQGGAMLVVGFVVASLRLMGAGDAKFIAAMAPFVALADAGRFLILLAICILLAFILHRLARVSPIRKMVPSWESWERTKDFPLGFPLAVSLIVYLGLYAIYG